MNQFFKKDFEALYAISMNMANECITNKPMEARFSKLHEEFHEVIEAFANYQNCDSDSQIMHKAKRLALISELSDLLFVLLHIGHKFDISAFELLHMASSKMLSRMNDPEYKAKN